MTGRRRALAGAGACGALLVGACAATAPPSAVPTPAPDVRAGLLRQVQAGAQAASSAGDLDRAIWDWRVAEALDADPTADRERAEALDARRTARARALVDEGERILAGARPNAAAAAAFRKALAIDPNRREARLALRRLDGQEMLKAVARSGAGGPPAPRPAAPRRSGNAAP